jgi:DNA polymerase III subunit gamma/tau
MNVKILIRASLDTDDLEREANEAFVDFCNRLESDVGTPSNEFASIAVIERDNDAIVCRVIAHVEEDQFESLQAFCRAWSVRAGCLAEVRHVPDGSKQLAFHVESIRELCAGYEEGHGETSTRSSLRRLLRIPRASWRSPGPFSRPKLILSARLSDRSIKEACGNGMTPLLAFDAEQWPWIFKGWELDEYRDRKAEVGQRRLQVSELHGRLRDDPARLQQELTSLSSNWHLAKSERRIRRWRGWW